MIVTYSERVMNWDVRVVRWSASVVGRPFEWGRTDCGSLCRGAIAALYGEGVVRRTLGVPWTTVESAVRFWRRVGSDAGGVLAALGARTVQHATLLQTGDIMVASGSDRHGLPRFGVVAGRKLITSHFDSGVGAVARSAAPRRSTFWRLP